MMKDSIFEILSCHDRVYVRPESIYFYENTFLIEAGTKGSVEETESFCLGGSWSNNGPEIVISVGNKMPIIEKHIEQHQKTIHYNVISYLASIGVRFIPVRFA